MFSPRSSLSRSSLRELKLVLTRSTFRRLCLRSFNLLSLPFLFQMSSHGTHREVNKPGCRQRGEIGNGRQPESPERSSTRPRPRSRSRSRSRSRPRAGRHQASDRVPALNLPGKNERRALKEGTRKPLTPGELQYLETISRSDRRTTSRRDDRRWSRSPAGRSSHRSRSPRRTPDRESASQRDDRRRSCSPNRASGYYSTSRRDERRRSRSRSLPRGGSYRRRSRSPYRTPERQSASRRDARRRSRSRPGGLRTPDYYSTLRRDARRRSRSISSPGRSAYRTSDRRSIS